MKKRNCFYSTNVMWNVLHDASATIKIGGIKKAM